MSRTKQKSEFVSGLGSAFEFVKAISDEVRRLGGNDDDLRKVMTQEALRKTIAASIMRETKTATKSSVTTPNTAIVDLIPKGWSVVEDVVPSTFKVSDLKFKSFLEGDESYVDGKTMRHRAIDMKGNLGLVDGQYLLEHQAEIPVDLRGKYIVLPGTLLRDSSGCLRVPCLGWAGGRWCLGLDWFGLGWVVFDRFACSE